MSSLRASKINILKLLVSGCLIFSQSQAVFASNLCQEVFAGHAMGSSSARSAEPPASKAPSLFERYQMWKHQVATPAEIRIHREAQIVIKQGFEGEGAFHGLIDFRPFIRSQKFLVELTQVNSDLRDRLITQVSEAKAATPEARVFQKLMLLALFEPQLWRSTMHDLMGVSMTTKTLVNYMNLQGQNPFGERMPRELRESLLLELGSHYSQLSKDKKEINFAPKRLADYYFKMLGRGDSVINQALTQGATPREAYETYWRHINRYIHPKNPYTPETVFEILNQIQSSLKSREPELMSSLQDRNTSATDIANDSGNVIANDKGADPEILVGGSVPNARGDLASSDIDISANFKIPESLSSEIGERLRLIVSGLRAQNDFHLSNAHVSRDFWAKVHPIVFRVRADRIDLLVYPVDSSQTQTQILPIKNTTTEK